MSVLVSDRKESRFEAIVFSEELHLMLIDLMHRNFGIKSLDRLVRAQYARGKLKTEDISYYYALLHCHRENVNRIAILLTNNVRAANSIYPKTEADWVQRRKFQNAAIVNCQQILKELQHVVTLFDIDLNIYDRYITAINREIGLIKKWRQRDYKTMSNSQKGGI